MRMLTLVSMFLCSWIGAVLWSLALQASAVQTFMAAMICGGLIGWYAAAASPLSKD